MYMIELTVINTYKNKNLMVNKLFTNVQSLPCFISQRRAELY